MHSFSFVRPLLGFSPITARSSLSTIQFLRHRSLSGFVICRQHLLPARAHVPQTWVVNRLGVPRKGQLLLPSFLTATGIAGIVLGIATCTAPIVHCDSKGTGTGSTPAPPPQAPLPESTVNLYELTFGTVAGVCAGVFVKKGAKMVAFFLGGVFVLLQYLGSMSLVRVDWGRMAARFENLLYTKDALGNKRPPTISSLWRWVVDFLTADFQPRASFIAGLALGLRIG
ncbi:FUN14 family-domain-containing protein [Suillus subalutaceus]|uniref:FUN14 family-domain-containing protein n=1 Tax=Suillus subalutaceus TaxID=48586 RepID=UPI001B88568D|nr:FUN14 family-domain-containing protein [Suillus subalutaceus]KAG1877882.1 FUN14 family-domain-containing protein [Suillus subalutaceus]